MILTLVKKLQQLQDIFNTMNAKNIKYFLTVTLLIPFIVLSQSARLNYANKLFDELAFSSASEAYEDVLERTKDSLSIAANISESYRRIGNIEKTSEWYDFIERNDELSQAQHLYSALIKRQLGQYDKSYRLFKSYEKKFETTDVTKSMIDNHEELSKLQENDANFTIKPLYLNSPDSEIGVSFFSDGDVLLASSERKNLIVNREDKSSGDHYYNLYRGTLNEDGELIEKNMLKGQINSKFHDGPACFDKENNLVYFTRNNFLNGKGVDDQSRMRLKIYRAELVEEKLENIEELSFNDDNYSCGHPSISADGKILYFISDKPGGFGGTDIYRTEMNEDGEFEDPVNLGEKINTSLNEFSPYIHPKDDLLFFASNGHFGLGGLDVFVTTLSNTKDIQSIKNLGAPINSSYDDFSFVNDTTQRFGFIVSNRDGGEGKDDIYGFTQKNPIKSSQTVEGTIKDLVSGGSLEEVEVVLKDNDGNEIKTVKTDSLGNFTIDLGEHKEDFKLVASKEDYVQEEKEFAFDESKSRYIHNIELAEGITYQFIGTIREKKSMKPLEGVQISVDNNKNDELVSKIKTNSKGDILGEDLPFTRNELIDIKVKLEKPGYVTKSKNLEIQLDENRKINLSDYMSVNMTKIEVGKTDLSEVANLEIIYFDLNSSYIREDAKVELDKIVQVMKDNPKMSIELGSHTDSQGELKYNMWLSDRRAKRSADYIISRGIDASRISGKGYGQRRPKVTDAEIARASSQEEKEELHQKNRRTEFIVVKME